MARRIWDVYYKDTYLGHAWAFNALEAIARVRAGYPFDHANYRAERGN